MQAAHRVAKNTGILYARMAITMFISLYATRLVLAALGVADFGLFNVVGGAIAMLGFLNSSMAAATQRFMSFAQGAGDLEKVKRIFNMSTLLHWGIAIVILLVLEILGYFFFNGVLNIAPERLGVAKIIYQFMVVSTLFTVISVPYEAVITSHENMMVYAVLGIIEAILKLGIALYITYSTQDHLVAYGFLMAALSIFLLILRRIYCHRYYAECVLKLRHYYDKPLLKEIGSFAMWSLFGSSSSMMANYGQGIILNIFFGTLVNAAQSIAAQISGQLSVFSLTLTKALNPLIDKSEGAGNRIIMLKATFSGTKISFFLLSFLYIPFLIEAPYILRLWLKNVPEYTIVFCRLLLFRNLIEQFFITLHSSLTAVGNIRKFQIYYSIINIFPLVLTYVLFSLSSPPAAIYVSFIIYAILHLFLAIYFTKINCGMSVSSYLKAVVYPCFISFVIIYLTSVIPFFILDEGFFRLFFIVILSIISFMLTVWNIGLSTDERLSVLKIKTNVLEKSKVVFNKKFC